MSVVERIELIVQKQSKEQEEKLQTLLQLLATSSSTSESSKHEVTCVICMENYEVGSGLVASFCAPEHEGGSSHPGHLICRQDCLTFFNTAHCTFDDDVHHRAWNTRGVACPLCRRSEGCGMLLGTDLHGRQQMSDVYVWIDGHVKSPLSEWPLPTPRPPPVCETPAPRDDDTSVSVTYSADNEGDGAAPAQVQMFAQTEVHHRMPMQDESEDEEYDCQVGDPSYHQSEVSASADVIINLVSDEDDNNATDADAVPQSSPTEGQRTSFKRLRPEEEPPSNFTRLLADVTCMTIPPRYARMLYEDGEGSVDDAVYLHFHVHGGNVPDNLK